MNIFKKAMSALTAAVVAATAATTLFSSTVFTADAAMSAVDLVEEMGIGWNLGNALDSVNTWDNPLTPEASEKGWGNPVTTKAMITEIEKTGFNTVRIPVTWSQWTDDSGNIDTVWLARVKEVVDYVVSQDMYAIINIHHDGANGVEDNWLTQGTAKQAKFTAMWKQIANYFADYGQELVFESMNEVEISDDQVKTLNQAFVDTVRATGGNNANRLLLVPAASNNTDKLLSSAFTAPTDSANMIAVSCHYYEPPTFCVAELDSTWGYDKDWGTNEDKTKAKNHFDSLKSKFIDKGIPVIIGEYGVVTNEGKDQQSIYDYLEYVAGTTYNMKGICPVVWDDGDSGTIKLFQRSTLTWYDSKVQNIFKTVANGNGPIDTNLTDRIVVPGSEAVVDAATGNDSLLIDLKPYKEMGLTVKTVVVNYDMSSSDRSTYGAGGAVSFNIVDDAGETHWACVNIAMTNDTNVVTAEIPDVNTATDEAGNTYTGPLDMDYLKVEEWYTWTDPGSGSCTLTLGDVTIIFDKEFYTDDIPDVTDTTTTTTDEPVVTTTTESTTKNDDTTTTTTVTTTAEPIVTTTTEAVDPDSVVANAWVAGQAGSYQFWNIDSAGQVPVQITGNGQYTASFQITEGDGTGSIECLILDTDLNVYAYAPDGTTDPVNECGVVITIDSIKADGVEIAYNGPSDGSLTTGNDGVSLRRNILNPWTSGTKIADIDGTELSLTKTLEVTFTISGLPEEQGEVTTTESSTDTTETTTTTTTTTETTTKAPTPTDVKYGDLNLDDSVALIDVIYLNKFLSGAITLNDQQKANADCVSDGALNSADAGALLKYTVEAITSLPINP